MPISLFTRNVTNYIDVNEETVNLENLKKKKYEFCKHYLHLQHRSSFGEKIPPPTQLGKLAGELSLLNKMPVFSLKRYT